MIGGHLGNFKPSTQKDGPQNAVKESFIGRGTDLYLFKHIYHRGPLHGGAGVFIHLAP